MKKSAIFVSFLYISSIVLTAAPITTFAESSSQNIDAKNQEIDDLKSQQSTVSGQITTLESEISTIYNKGIELTRTKNELTKSSKELEKEISDLNTRIEKRTEAIQKQGRNVQVNGQGSKMLDILLNSESIGDAIGRVQAITSIITANNDLVNQQKEDKEAVVTKKATIEENIKSIDKANKELATETESLLDKQADLNVLKANLESQTSDAENSKNELIKEQQEALKVQRENEAKEAEQKATEASSESATTAQSSDTSSGSSSSQQSSGSSSTNTNSGSSSTNTNSGSTNTTTTNNSSDATFQALNALRVANGLNPVSWNASLAASATSRAASMQTTLEVPADHWTRGNEVIAFMFAPGNSVIMAWFNETNMVSASGTGHRDWELNPNMTSVGFGYAGSVVVGHSA